MQGLGKKKVRKSIKTLFPQKFRAPLFRKNVYTFYEPAPYHLATFYLPTPQKKIPAAAMATGILDVRCMRCDV